MTRKLWTAVLCLTATVACGKSPQQQAAENAAKAVQNAQEGSQSVAQSLQQMAQGLQQMTQNGGAAAAKPVDYDQLKTLVPDVSGWTKGDVKGEQLSSPMAYSRANTTYDKDNSHMELEITDSAMSQMLLAPISMFLSAGFSEKSDDGYKRATKINNQPGFQDWEAPSKHGEVTAVVGGRFIVHATGNDIDSIDPVEKLVEAVDFNKLASMK